MISHILLPKAMQATGDSRKGPKTTFCTLAAAAWPDCRSEERQSREMSICTRTEEQTGTEGGDGRKVGCGGEYVSKTWELRRGRHGGGQVLGSSNQGLRLLWLMKSKPESGSSRKRVRRTAGETGRMPKLQNSKQGVESSLEKAELRGMRKRNRKELVWAGIGQATQVTAGQTWTRIKLWKDK